MSHWEADLVGEAAMVLGAGRATKEDQIDPQVGLILKAKVGDWVQEGDEIVTIYSNHEDVSEAVNRLDQALEIGGLVEERPLIYELIED